MDRKISFFFNQLNQSIFKRFKIIVTRRKISRIMTKRNLSSTYTSPGLKFIMRRASSHVPYILNRYKWNYTYLLVDLLNHIIIGFRADIQKNAELVFDSFATVHAYLNQIQLFHTDSSGEFDNHIFNMVLNTCYISRSLSLKGCPYDNAVAEATFKIFKSKFVYSRNLGSLTKL